MHDFHYSFGSSRVVELRIPISLPFSGRGIDFAEEAPGEVQSLAEYFGAELERLNEDLGPEKMDDLRSELGDYVDYIDFAQVSAGTVWRWVAWLIATDEAEVVQMRLFNAGYYQIETFQDEDGGWHCCMVAPGCLPDTDEPFVDGDENEEDAFRSFIDDLACMG